MDLTRQYENSPTMAKVISLAKPEQHKAQGGEQPAIGDVVRRAPYSGWGWTWWICDDKQYGALFRSEHLEIIHNPVLDGID